MSGASWVGRVACALLAAACLACERTPQPAADSSTSDTATPVGRSDVPSSWAAELGAALLVPGDSEQTAVMLYPSRPNNAVVGAAVFRLLSPAGDSMTTAVTLLANESQVCGEVPTVRLRNEVPRAWTAGLLTRRAAILPMDSIETMPSADSARLVANLARMASALPGGSDAKFRGLPFVVVGARRFAAPDREFLVAHLVRRLPQEATPLEERVFFIAERERSALAAAYTTSFHLRSAGTEDTAEHYEVLSALRGDASVYLLLARDQEARTSYELLERARGAWRTRWVRALEC